MFLLGVSLCALAWGEQARLDPRELIARHLDAIGPAGALSDRTSTVARGIVRVILMVGGSGYMEGPAVLSTDRNRSSLLLDFNRPEYLHEHFIYDGENSNTAFMRPGFRSPLGEFLFTYSEIMREGLLGGALSSRWTLLRTEETRPRLRYRGLKKFEDRRLHELDYEMRRGGRDLRMRLYFDPETFRHEATTYDIAISPNMGATPGQSSRLRTMRLRLVERFADFRSEGGLAMPTHWEMEFSQEGTLQGVLWKWVMDFDRIDHNLELDDASFTLK